MKVGWPVGCNFIPSTAINRLGMWQKDIYDPNTIDCKLGLAEEIGFSDLYFSSDKSRATSDEFALKGYQFSFES